MDTREFDNSGNQNFFRIPSSNNAIEQSSRLQMASINKRKKHITSNSAKGVNTSTCQQLADIIGGDVITSTPVCVVQRLRDINATILGRRTRSPLALPFALSFEDDQNGNTLNLGETVILQEEINPFLSALRKRGITVTAIHNHWLFEEPRLMYMHWENVGDPFVFAKNSIEAARKVGIF